VQGGKWREGEERRLGETDLHARHEYTVTLCSMMIMTIRYDMISYNII
jgi:hypothetical protein